MPTEYERTDQFRDARIHLSDLQGLEIRDCEVDGMRIVDCYGADLHVAGAFDRIVVNDVDVTSFVEAELDRQHPVRALAREVSTPEDYRIVWQQLEDLWAATVRRAERLPTATVHERVHGEWSFVETLRHLLFASDAWLGNTVLEEENPYHPLGFPAGGTPEEDLQRIGLTPAATPTLDEVLQARSARMATMRATVEALTAAELDRVCGRKPGDFYPDQAYRVGRCLRVVLKEEAEHHRYAVRDLAALEPTA